MSMKNQIGPKTSRQDAVRPNPLPGCRLVSIATLVASASAAFAQAEKRGPAPLEETWQYLMDLFRMILGI